MAVHLRDIQDYLLISTCSSAMNHDEWVMWCMQDEQTQVCGLVVIENYTGFGLTHARHFDQKAAKLFTSLIQVLLCIMLNAV